MLLQEIFEMFYAEVRAHQYLYYLINIVYIQDNYLPILDHTDDQVVIQNDISYYYEDKEIPSINKAILNNIVHNPRTYLFNIDKSGMYKLSFETNETDQVKAAIDELNKKIYKKIDVKIDAKETKQ